MELITERLVLREFCESDFRDVHLYSSDPGTTEFMDWGPNSEGETRVFLKTVVEAQVKTPRTSYVLGITDKELGGVIGSIGIEIQSAINRSASFGYILRKDCWGKGIATEAAQTIVKFGFEELNLHRIWATCRPQNNRSMHVLKKLGFEKEGYLRDEKFIRGRFQDSVLFAKIAN